MARILAFKAPARTAPETVKRRQFRKPRNADVRSREFLTPDEVERLMKAARSTGRHRHRDATIILLGYRHALRVSELTRLRWDAVDLAQGTVYVRRLKGSTDSTHPLGGVELRALRRLQRTYPASPYVFTTQLKGPLTPSSVRRIVARAGEIAGLGFPVHPHSLRHAAGYALANRGVDTRSLQAFMGHKQIQHTVKYSNIAPERFKNFWRD